MGVKEYSVSLTRSKKVEERVARECSMECNHAREIPRTKGDGKANANS